MADPRARRDSLLQPIRVPRAANLLVEELRGRILSGELVEGELLPSERTLVEQTGLGRATVREGLRVLETEGLVGAGLGRYGGWVVQRPGQATVARSIEAFIRGRQIHFESLMETREALEPACAALAAVHRDDDDLARLDACTENLRGSSDDVGAYLLNNLRWHLAVVAATHNELLIAVMSALADAVHAGTDIDNFNSDRVMRAVIVAHERVVDAIRAGDADAASRRMYRHVHAFRTQVEATLVGGGKLSETYGPPAADPVLGSVVPRRRRGTGR